MRTFINLIILSATLTATTAFNLFVFDKNAFYTAMASNDLTTINNQLSILKTASINEKEAYEGALMMRKAGLITKAKEKLILFKNGRLKLETAIKKDRDNTEYYFLRLIIQEHAPKLVEYRNNIEKDVTIIRTNYKKLSPEVQQAVNDYIKKSTALKSL